MDKTEKELINAINHYKESLHKYSSDDNVNENKLMYYIGKLHNYPVKIRHLEETGIGLTVNGLRKLGGEVADSAKNLITKWKKMVVEESNNQEEDEDDEEEDDEDDDDDEDVDDDDDRDEEIEKERRKRTAEKERLKLKESAHRNHHHKEEKHKEKSLSSHKHHHSEKNVSSSGGTSRDKDKYRNHKKDTIHNRSEKRKQSQVSEDSDDGRCEEKKVKKKRIESDSESQSEVEESNKSSYKHKSEKKKASSSNSESEEKQDKYEKSKHKSKESEKTTKRKHDSNSNGSVKHKKQEDKSDTRSGSSSSGSKKEKHKKESSHRKESSSKHGRDKSDDKKDGFSHKDKHCDNKKDKSKREVAKTQKLIHSDGIDSESGASFAEALGMLEPSTSKGVKKKVSSPLRSDKNPPQSSSKVKTEIMPPALLKPPNLEPLDVSISSLLPTITPNYRPLGIIGDNAHQRHKSNYDDEALCRVMSSKNQRTKVYSGNKSIWGYVPTLFELCTRVLQDNIDALEYTGGVPYSILKPVLEKATPNQLFQMEHHNPYLIEDTDELWQLHCGKEFKNKRREELETWREMYMRCLDEREAKLIALTANIKQSQDKSMPVRQTKLAYVDSFVKPPRDIARRQAKNGTKSTITPSAKLTSLATAGAAGQVSVPNPGPRAVERSGGSSSAVQKPKKAPLMQKALAAIKNRFRR